MVDQNEQIVPLLPRECPECGNYSALCYSRAARGSLLHRVCKLCDYDWYPDDEHPFDALSQHTRDQLERIEQGACHVCGRSARQSWCGQCDIIGKIDARDIKIAIDIFLKAFSDRTFTRITGSIKKFGKGNWVNRMGMHFTWGIGARNLLRRKGFLDEMSPSNNLDDIYVQLVELACDRWEYNKETDEA